MKIFQFGYAVSRPYPYPWFKWVVLVGGVVATALFTALSLASSGYAIQVQRTSNYNVTQSAKRWTQNWPFSLLAASTTCLSNEMSVGSKFWTDKYGLPYTLAQVYTRQPDEVPILTYTNNALENCSIGYMQVTLEPLEISGTQLMVPVGNSQQYQGQGNHRWSPRATAYINCTISNDVEPTLFTLTTQYQYVTRAEAMTNFPRPPQQNQTSLYWAKSLLTWYWGSLACRGWDSPDYIRAYGLFPRTTDPDINITSKRFFGVPQFWLQDDATTQADTWSRDSLYDAGIFNDTDTLEVRIEVDWFAKAVYAAILADLGQSEHHPRDNALLYPELLDNLSSRIDDLQAEVKANPGWVCLVSEGPAQSKYRPGIDPGLNITPSYIATSYQCNVPTLKTTGSLILSVILADFVLLQTAWKLLNLITEAWHDYTDPTAHHCEGCVGATNNDTKLSPVGISDVPLKTLRPTRTGYIPLPGETRFETRDVVS